MTTTTTNLSSEINWPPVWPPNSETAARWLEPLVALTGLPTATGREAAVIAFITEWVKQREDLKMTRDEHGNLTIRFVDESELAAEKPIIVTAHLDHPAFVVESVDRESGDFTASFRGGVRPSYFVGTPVRIHPGATPSAKHAITAKVLTHEPAKGDRWLVRVTLELTDPATMDQISAGDVAVWDLPAVKIQDGILHAPACDDLAGAAAALCALDEVRPYENRRNRAKTQKSTKKTTIRPCIRCGFCSRSPRKSVSSARSVRPSPARRRAGAG